MAFLSKSWIFELYIIFQITEFQFALFVFLQLERAWNSLTWTEKLSLVTSVIRGITSSSDMSTNSLKVDLLPRFICYLDDPICSLLKFDKEGGREERGEREREREKEIPGSEISASLLKFPQKVLFYMTCSILSQNQTGMLFFNSA
jgi:hypothetical protein